MSRTLRNRRLIDSGTLLRRPAILQSTGEPARRAARCSFGRHQFPHNLSVAQIPQPREPIARGAPAARRLRTRTTGDRRTNHLTRGIRIASARGAVTTAAGVRNNGDDAAQIASMVQGLTEAERRLAGHPRICTRSSSPNARSPGKEMANHQTKASRTAKNRSWRKRAPGKPTIT